MEHSELAALNLEQLIDCLDDLEQKRTPVGWTPDDAVLKASVERRILELIGEDVADSERRSGMRIPCHMMVLVRAKDRSITGTVANIGKGGAFVATASSLPRGTHVNVEIRGAGDERGLRARGRVAWTTEEGTPGLGISFSEQPSSAHERRLHRFVMEVLRHRAEA